MSPGPTPTTKRNSYLLTAEEVCTSAAKRTPILCFHCSSCSSLAAKQVSLLDAGTWAASLWNWRRYENPTGLSHSDGHKLIPSSGGREVDLSKFGFAALAALAEGVTPKAAICWQEADSIAKSIAAA